MEVTTTRELYDIDVSVIAELQMKLATIKIEAGKKLVDKLQLVYHSERDEERLMKVLNAIEWNKKLIKEIKDSE